jgi:hypothetical protein
VAKDPPNCSDGVNYVDYSAVVIHATPTAGHKFCRWSFTPAGTGVGCDGSSVANCAIVKSAVDEVGQAIFKPTNQACP